jgi:hypothetical protein
MYVRACARASIYVSMHCIESIIKGSISLELQQDITLLLLDLIVVIVSIIVVAAN